MRLLIKQRVFSWTDTYDVYDEYEHPKYFVKAEFLTLGHQIHVYDQSGNEIGMVKQRFPTLLPAFDIEVNGQECGSIQRMFSFLKPRYEIDYNGWLLSCLDSITCRIRTLLRAISVFKWPDCQTSSCVLSASFCSDSSSCFFASFS